MKSLRGGIAVVGGFNLGGGLDPVHDTASVAEMAVEKGATTPLIPASARKQLNDLSDEMSVKHSVLFDADGRDALLKGQGD